MTLIGDGFNPALSVIKMNNNKYAYIVRPAGFFFHELYIVVGAESPKDAYTKAMADTDFVNRIKYAMAKDAAKKIRDASEDFIDYEIRTHSHWSNRR